jgi:quinoprotein dehydrogenase-associated probable ABC transporter substrate-binding protein
MRPRPDARAAWPLLLLMLGLAAPAREAFALRVCSDPNNLPFSNRALEGFENKIAALVAHDLGETLEYTFAAQHKTFAARTLDAHRCDLIMGVPIGMPGMTETRPYYRSSYVFVYRADHDLHLHSLRDARLRQLKIGVHLIGADDLPPVVALGELGIVDNVSGYMIYGDYAEPNPPARLVEAVADQRIDVAVVWGPLAGFFAKASTVPLRIVGIDDTASFAPLRFRYGIAMGVRSGDVALRERLDRVIEHERATLRATLRDYGVPLLEPTGAAHE